MVESLENQVSSWPEGLEVGRSLKRSKDSEVLIKVVRISDQLVYVEQNMVFGPCDDVEQVSPEEKVIACHTRQGAVKTKSNEEKKRQRVPEYLQDLLESSGQSFSKEEKGPRRAATQIYECVSKR